MDKIIALLIAFILGLFGINRWQSSRIKRQKEEIKQTEKKVEKRESELKEVRDVQKEIREIKNEEPPKETPAPPGGDHDSRLDRLNRLHDN